MASIKRIIDDNWELPYTPRKEMREFHQRTLRFAFLICHRRYGKTVACVAELIIRALYTKKKNARYAYVCPYRSQAKAVAWQYLCDMTQGIATKESISELMVELPNGAKIFLTGSDNPNAIRGQYLDGAVLDEFAQARPTLLDAVIFPCLLDRKGWLVIIGTAYGRMNQFHHYYEESRDNPDEWFHADIKVYDSGVIPEEEIERIRKVQSDAKFKQEFLNDFSAELIGTYYADGINKLEQEGKLHKTRLYSPQDTVNVAFDIGRGDSTVIWFWQERPDGLAIIDHYDSNGKQAQHYIDYLIGKPYIYQDIWLPHDARAKTFATHKSALEQFVEATQDINGVCNLTGSVHITPQLSVEDGIEAARQTIPMCHFDYDQCYTGVEALRVYRKRWDEVNQCFSKTPQHDFASDHADAFRYLAIVANPHRMAPPLPHESLQRAIPNKNTYNLEHLYAEREARQPRGIAKMRV